MNSYLAVLTAAMVPFLVWFIEYFIPYPEILEELAKLGLVWFFIVPVIGKRDKVSLSLLMAIMFTMTETTLYVMNFAPRGSFWPLISRFGLTLGLHGLTFLILAISGSRSAKGLVWGLLAGIALHYAYNAVFFGVGY